MRCAHCHRDARGADGDGAPACWRHEAAQGPDTTRDADGPHRPAQARSGRASAPPRPGGEGGASPEVGTGDAPNGSTTGPDWAFLWAEVNAELEGAEQRLAEMRARRTALLRRMADAGMTLRQIGAVAGMSGQRVGKLLG